MKCLPKMEGVGLLALRIAIGFIFVFQGYSKLFVMTAGATQMFGGLGFPAPAFWVYLVGILELVGGLMVLLGVYTRIAAAWLGVIMIVAMLTAHFGGPVMGYFLPLALLGGNLALAGVGAGPYRLVKNECFCPKCRAACSDGACADGEMKDQGCGDMKGGGCCGGSSCGMDDQKMDMMKDKSMEGMKK